jgi:glucose-6-phosphate 1-dehydrogenase
MTAKPAPNCAMVLFGANGDLTKRLVVPALYNLAKTGLLPEKFALIGVDHNDKTAEQWRTDLRAFLEQLTAKTGAVDSAAWDRLAASMSYLCGDFQDAATFTRLRDQLAGIDKSAALGGNALFYLAVADRFFATLVDGLAGAALLKEQPGWRRVVIEKPFGHDLPSARALNAHILKCLREDQIFRIDHFLGKETVQNIMALRFANGLFEPIWNRDRIDHVQVTVAESIGIERRGSFYEATGALRDMVPNHLFQLVAMTAMEPPVSFDAEAVRTKKADVFRAVHPLAPDDVVRGQYGPGEIDGAALAGYRQEANVDPNSSVETFVALRLRIDNWRWAGVPFYLRTGKRMPKRSTEIAIRFKEAPYALFRDTPVDEFGANWLIIQVQPDEGIRLRFNAKRPGTVLALENVAMDFKYADWFGQASAVGYETLLYDCFTGDSTLFQRADQVEASWAIVQPVLDAWHKQAATDFPNYAAGTAGPAAADELLARDGRKWRKVKPQESKE